MELKSGQKVNLTIDVQATVIKELGRGGQGIVYLVELDGKEWALKWYITPPGDHFYQNLKYNIDNEAPSDAFIWPEFLTKKENGSYGYIMKLRPKGYYEFGNFLLAKRQFSSFDAMLSAANKICEGFEKLHLKGLSYQDLNDGNFFINPETGDVLICDNDNVMPQGDHSGIRGKSRYMAPEITLGGNPDKFSDRFSLAVILFLLFYGNHPFEGKHVLKYPCLTENIERELYGSNPVFIYDPADNSNRPVRGVHTNVLRRWSVFPSILKNTFIEQFNQQHLKDPKARMLEQEWIDIIARLRDALVRCPSCMRESFVELGSGDNRCMCCGEPIDISHKLKMGRRTLILTPGTTLYIDKDNVPDAIVERYEKNPDLLVIKNLMPKSWACVTSKGIARPLGPGNILPVKAGIKINFMAGYSAEIIS